MTGDGENAFCSACWNLGQDLGFPFGKPKRFQTNEKTCLFRVYSRRPFSADLGFLFGISAISVILDLDQT